MRLADVNLVVLSLVWICLLHNCSSQADDIPADTDEGAMLSVDIAKDVCSVTKPCPPAQSCRILEQVGYICRCPAGFVGINCTTECRTHAADIAFLVDSSDSISEEDWVKMLRFVSSVVGQLQVNEGYHRIAVITFGDEPTLDIRLDDFNTSNGVITKVKELVHKKERTNIAGTLRLMRTAVFGGEGSRMQIGFLITDGASNVEREYTFEEARLVKEADIVMFAIGIGHLIRRIELEAVASRPLSKHLFLEYSFEALKNIINIVLESTCKLAPKYSMGATGYTGLPGVNGSVGLKGLMGDPGPNGDVGLKGEMGSHGSPGRAGEKGVRGWPGETGATGDPGKQGPPGERGTAGPPGDKGDPGPPGRAIVGLPGNKGARGPQGPVGATGAPGHEGLTGSVGVMGYTGLSGVPGPSGDVGSPGATGFTGKRGPVGSTGFTGPRGEGGPTGFIYEDSDECALNTSLCQHICINERSGYKCQCRSGYKLLRDGFSCAEINECLDRNGGCEQKCTNTDGSFVCSCLFGYTMSKDGRTCIDVNECCLVQTPVSPCPPTCACINTRGSYVCITKERVRLPGQELRLLTTTIANSTVVTSMFLQRRVVIGVFIWLCVLTVLAIICVLLANTVSYSSTPSAQQLRDPFYHRDDGPQPSGPPLEDNPDMLNRLGGDATRNLIRDPIAAQIEINHRPESVVQNTTK